MANEADRGRREQLDRAMWEATEEHLNPVYLDGVEIVQRELPSLGVRRTSSSTSASASG